MSDDPAAGQDTAESTAEGQNDDANGPENGKHSENDNGSGLTYADAGVDIAASETATQALIGAVAGDPPTDGAYAGLYDLGDQSLALTTDGVGTKLLVASAMDEFSTIGIDCVAMNVNDLVAAGVRPLAFVDYLAVDEPDAARAAELGEGLSAGADAAGVALLGGETAVLPAVVDGFDLAGTAAGLAPNANLFPGEAAPGDALVGFASSGIHANGLTLARQSVTREYEYTDPVPFDSARSVGEALLEPTRIYVEYLDALRRHDTRAAAHITGGGWRNLRRMGAFRYVVTDPLPAQAVFGLVQSTGGVSDAEMHRTFNMGTGFVAALAPAHAEKLAAETDGEIIGRVRERTDEHHTDDTTPEAESDGGTVSVRGIEL
ncbi:MAG: phosphoribosylaminoimidazole synthetase [halophilic archaeon J07HX5]|nr:MAG: phosphoribosylaminoimidazole synthetase [halophilic archaeon J07HX5]